MNDEHNLPVPTSAPEPKKEIQVSIAPDHQPTFSNVVNINVSNEEVALQFLYARPNSKSATLVSEVILTPQHAIRLQRALDDTIKRHFTRHLEGK